MVHLLYQASLYHLYLSSQTCGQSLAPVSSARLMLAAGLNHLKYLGTGSLNRKEYST